MLTSQYLYKTANRYLGWGKYLFAKVSETFDLSQIYNSIEETFYLFRNSLSCKQTLSGAQ